MDCNEQHAADLLSGDVVPNSREAAIFRLCANVKADRVRSILDALGDDYEWRRIPGCERYEASEHGQIRRASTGNGSQPGHVLRTKTGKHGHLFVTIGPEGQRLRPMSVHRAVCLAFHGLPPSPDHIVLHGNDVPHDNRKDNLRWGTHRENAVDRAKNAGRGIKGKIGTRLARAPKTALAEGAISRREAQNLSKAAMTYRLGKTSA